jgi:hypothetical protein
MRALTVVVAAALLMVTVGCARGQVGVVTVAPPSATQLFEVYAVPAAKPSGDVSLLRRATVGGTAQPLGRGTDPRYVASSAPGVPDQVLWYSSATGAVTLLRPGAATATVSADAAATVLQLGAAYYVQAGERVVATTGRAVTASYPLPVLAPDPVAGVAPRGYKGTFSGRGVGQISALVPSSAGHVLAFSSTGWGAAVTDLTTGQTRSLPGLGSLGSAARDRSGNIVVLAWRGLDLGWTVHAVTVDASTLAVRGSVDTEVSPRALLADQVLPGLGHDAVLVLAYGDEASGVTLRLWTMDGTTLSPGPRLPVGAGLQLAPAGPTSAYVFGGPARNRVGRLELASGAFDADVAALRAPSGAYVIGVLAG